MFVFPPCNSIHRVLTLVNRSTGHTHTTAEHTTAEQTTHMNTKRATAQRRLIVEVVVAALKIVVVRWSIP